MWQKIQHKDGETKANVAVNREQILEYTTVFNEVWALLNSPEQTKETEKGNVKGSGLTFPIKWSDVTLLSGAINFANQSSTFIFRRASETAFRKSTLVYRENFMFNLFSPSISFTSIFFNSLGKSLKNSALFQ